MNAEQLKQYEELAAGALLLGRDRHASAIMALIAEVERLQRELQQAQAQLAAKEPLQLANWTIAPKWAEWHAVDSDGRGHWFQKSPAMTADYWCSEMDGDSTYSAWFTLDSPDDWERTREERPLPF